MSKIPIKELVVFSIIAVLAMSGLTFHFQESSPSDNHLTSPVLLNKVSNPVMKDSIPSSTDTTVYLTGNITVGAGQVLSIVNENVVLESLSLNSISVSSYGSVVIRNSSLTISTAAYSIVREFFLRAFNGSSLMISNSTVDLSGAIDLNSSFATISNSDLNSSQSASGSPYESTLSMEGNNSTLRVYNSTISGLYRQHGAHEYSDAGFYLNQPMFSQQNATVPLSQSSVRREGSMINGVRINVTYVGNVTGDNNSLWVYYNNTLEGEYTLPYTHGESYAEKNITVNFTGTDHAVGWMEESSNFRLVSHIHYSDAIAIENLTETFRSNDTVSLYGAGIYSYDFTNSTVLFFNTSLGLNSYSYLTTNGEYNPYRLSLIAYNSTILLGDTNITSDGSYADPFFTLHNSSLNLFRIVDASLYSHGIPVTNGSYSVNGSGSAAVSESMELNRTLDEVDASWIMNFTYPPVSYEAYSDKGSNYTNQFYARDGNSSEIFSIQPFPYLSRNPMNLSFNTDTPYSSFSIENAHIGHNGTGTVNVSFNGDLASLKVLNITLSVHNSNGTMLTQAANFPSPGVNGTLVIHLDAGVEFPPGSYVISIHAYSGQAYAFENSGYANCTYYIQATPLPKVTIYKFQINETGLPAGSIWGLKNASSYFLTPNSSLILSLNGSSRMSVVSPAGMKPSSTGMNLTIGTYQYSVKFTRILYTLTFYNTNVSAGSTWQVTVGGHTYSSSVGSLSVRLQPGVYNYEVSDPSGYTMKHSSGIVNLSVSPAEVHIASTFHQSLKVLITHRISRPLYYLPLAGAVMALISVAGWKASHAWYVCGKCGSTRKRRKGPCPYCGK